VRVTVGSPEANDRFLAALRDALGEPAAAPPPATPQEASDR
jgi:hypothetical protein